MEQNINAILSYINSLELQWLLPLLKPVFVVFGLFLLIIILYFLATTEFLRLKFFQDWIEFFTHQPYGLRKAARAWQKIMKKLETANESEYKLLVIEADEMLDDILEKAGFSGQTLDERLKKLSEGILSNIDEIQEAHKIRNRIIHDPDYRLDLDQTKKALTAYEQALYDLQMF